MNVIKTHVNEYLTSLRSTKKCVLKYVSTLVFIKSFQGWQ